VRGPSALRVISAGAVTSVGNDLPSTSAAILAALDNFADTHFVDRRAEPLSGAAFSLPDAENQPGARLGGAGKLGLALSWAVEECLAASGVTLPLPASVPLLFLGDDTRPSPIVEMAHLCHSACAGYFAGPGQLHMQAFMSGEAAGVQALRAARELLAGGAPYVLVAAADSWLRVPDIEQSLQRERLLCTGNGSGFVPGEAAAAILLAGPRSPAQRGDQPVLQLEGLGTGEEPAHLLGDEPCYGRGMASAIRAALAEAGWAAHDIHLRLTDNAGEAYFAAELAYAWARVLREAQPPGNDYIQLATRTGHVGAAFGPLMLAHLWQLARFGRAAGPKALIHLSSTQPLRGAIAARIE
jgi:3-oxoacyl-[acyl-carrier-protein] synthase I